MRIQHWEHIRVEADGTCYDELGKISGHVETEPSLEMSKDEVDGCVLENCKCSDGHWLKISFGRNSKTQSASGVTVWFDNWGEMQLFLTIRNI